MSSRSLSELILRTPPLLHVDDTIEVAVRRVLDSDQPALPVVDAHERYAGIFGEREFIEAAFPGYLKHLRHAAFVDRSLDDALETRIGAAAEPVRRHMNTEHVEVGPDFSDIQVAEIFVHHRVLVVPIVADRRVQAMLTRRDFVRAVGERFVRQR